MKLSDTDLDILTYGLEDHIEKLQEFLNFQNSKAIAETRELLSRIEHEKIRRQELARNA